LLALSRLLVYSVLIFWLIVWLLVLLLGR
jgi:hypothetical protein